MSKTVIISDIHQRQHVAEHIIKSENPEKVIFLGDYFDSYIESPDDTRNTAEWLKWSINRPERIHLLGNHDISYWFPRNTKLRCPGWNPFKQMLVDEHLGAADFHKCLFYYNLDDKWLLSHAGAHPHWTLPKRPGEITRSDIQSLEKILCGEAEKFIAAAYKGESHWFAAWSRARSGTPHPGGLLWCDFSGDFHITPGVNQLVGHSSDYNVRWSFRTEDDARQRWHVGCDLKVKYGAAASYNLCLDTNNSHYAVWDGLGLNIKKLPDIII